MAKAKVKTLLGTGLAALCSHIKQCNTALGDLSEATANGFEETDDILHEKQDVTAAVSFTIPVDGWGEDDSSPGYFYCDIPIAGLLATDIVDVTVPLSRTTTRKSPQTSSGPSLPARADARRR